MDKKEMNDLIARLNERLKEKYSYKYIKGRLVFNVGEMHFAIDILTAGRSLVLEYADTLEVAQSCLPDDGDSFPVEWGEDKVFEEMVKEIEDAVQYQQKLRAEYK